METSADEGNDETNVYLTLMTGDKTRVNIKLDINNTLSLFFH